MVQRLNQEQLGQIVAEVERLQQRQEAELDLEQVKQILQELNLSPELLDEALIQLHRRQVLEVQQRRNRKIALGAIAALVVATAGTVFFIQQHNSTIGRVFAIQDRITLSQDDGGNLNSVDRQSNPEIFYRVTLKDAPVGKKLDLSCNWLAPNGQIVKQNRYQTNEINTSVWNTHCRNTIGSGAPTGNWQVRMFNGDRQLSDAEFQVK
ncbi:DUF3859 domain-containing protein [Iningainema tapete]|uniref:DUF3859 domain-containing protein n=1 Tax=Iningainema tapete BLCC-T55 TaxID=2748662 RepID=A0A8J6XRE6_9CYAN|nr:DUF3859 domain-containing protein [Iningainema tapete]MBD2776944.1 DUF3859 domain-containing protein [Iningainema tapete BLCC-T55]